MNKPRIFISSVTTEYGGIRNMVAQVVRSLGYETVTMDDWPAGHGELLKWLRVQIDSCEGIVHIPGMAYGAEPAEHDPEANGIPADFPRYSYTQYEFLYGNAIGKKIWVITPGEECSRDNPLEVLDYPKDADVADPAAYQQERREIQKQWLAYLETKNFIRHQPSDDKDLKLMIHTLRDHAEEMRGQFSEWQGFISSQLIAFEKRQKMIRLLSIVSVVLLLAAMPVLYFLKKDTKEISEKQTEIVKQVTEGDAALGKQLSEVQAALSKIQEQSAADEKPLSERPKEELEATLAAQMEIPVEDLRKLLSAGKTSEDALVQAQALLGSGDIAAAGEKFDQVIAEFDGATGQTSLRLAEAYAGKAQIAFDGIDYRSALGFRKKAMAAIDKDDNPAQWIDAAQKVTILQLKLAEYDDAEPLMREIINVCEELYGPDDVDVSVSLNNLGQLLNDNDRLEEAEPIMRRVLEIDISIHGENDPGVTRAMSNLAVLLGDTGRLVEAEELLRRALAIEEENLGENHPNVGIRLNNLAQLLVERGNYEQAELMMRRALAISESSLGENHPVVAIRLNNLALLLKDTGRLEEAEPLMRRTLAIDEAVYGENHPDVAIDLANLASLLRDMKRFEEAEPHLLRSLAIKEENYDENHSSIVNGIASLGNLMLKMERYEDAEPFFIRGLAIGEAKYGKDSPALVWDIEKLLEIYKELERQEDTLPLLERLLMIKEAEYGGSHPIVADLLNKLAVLLHKLDRTAESEPLMRRAVGILLLHQVDKGEKHEDIMLYLENYRVFTLELEIGDEEAERRLALESEKAGMDEAVFGEMWAEMVENY